MNKLALVFMSLLCTVCANARLGETVEECDARYGEPISISGNLRCYLVVNGTVKISCGFLSEKCEIIDFLKTNGSILSEDEVSQFLDKNSTDHNFQQVGDADGTLMFSEPQSGRMAFFQKGFTTSKKFPKGMLRILGKVSSEKMDEAVKDRKKQFDKL